ncbi:iron chaperone [Demequina pelophila]|uniref:iron chaperone n=1 Tax=Demequina pelophila TaxID=1638984 RepID=UPI000785F5A7|nr:DUF1801 domain-containing protein [Demequina pelophila]
MTTAEIDAYLATLDEPRRGTLAALRADLADLLPDAEQGMSYSVPAFRVGGKLVAGFSAAARHLSYLPHSGSVLRDMDPAALEGYSWSKGALKFAVDAPLPRALVERLVRARLHEIGN